VNQTERELLEQARKAMRDDKNLAEALSGLLKHGAWPIFAGLINDIAQTRGEEFFRAVRPEEALAQEFNKGTVNGLLMTIELPNLIIQQMKSVREPDEGDE